MALLYVLSIYTLPIFSSLRTWGTTSLLPKTHEAPQEIVSKKTGIPVAEIYGVVTFYSFFSLKPKGKYVLGVCLGTACYVKNSQAIIDKFAALLGIAPGETTDDGLFTIEAVRCIGACALAPAMSINGKVYPKVTPDQVGKIIDEYRKLEAEGK